MGSPLGRDSHENAVIARYGSTEAICILDGERLDCFAALAMTKGKRLAITGKAIVTWCHLSTGDPL